MKVTKKLRKEKFIETYEQIKSYFFKDKNDDLQGQRLIRFDNTLEIDSVKNDETNGIEIIIKL